MNTINTSLFESLINAMPCRACVFNDKLEMLAFNDGFAALLLRYHHITLKKHETLHDKVAEEHRQYWLPIMKEALKGKAYSQVAEINGVKETYYASVNVKPLMDDEKVAWVLLEVNDITEEKKNEEYLSAFRQLAGNLPNTDVFLCDNKMNVLIAGGGEMKKFNSDARSFEGKNMLDLAVEFNVELLIPYYNKSMNGQGANVEYQYGQGYYSVDICPIMENGEVKNIIILARNITEAKNISLRIQQLNHTKDSILHVVAHDLRNPISAILSVLDLSKEKPETLLHENYSMIERSCNMLLSTINNLLDISELGKEEYVLETEMIYLNEYLNELVHSNRFIAESKQISLEFESDQSDVFTNLNQDKFAKVFNNILINAIKFSKPEQKVVISTTRKKKKVLICIKDEGIGIPENIKSYIFDPFTKAGRRGTAGEKSMGLGMSIARQIVLLHNGTIWVESEENKGTTVNIELDSAI